MYSIGNLDWIVIFTYLIGLIVFAYLLCRNQFSREDYYIGARSMGHWPISISIMATQCSTNSILGAPAFVAFAAGGGLGWLQYELAVPLAMIVLMLIYIPSFRKLNLLTVYEYLERRFDHNTRRLLSGIFLFVRAFATAVTVYGIAIVVDLITGIGFFWSAILLGAFTVLYDTLGGIKGVIYSDVLQLAILVLILLLVCVMLVNDAGGLAPLFDAFPDERRNAIDFSHHGLGDGENFAFWPMLLGGFFLYVSYYGCDQSQLQRALTARDINTANKAFFINGLLRFPLVALYCLVGVGIAYHASTSNHDFIASLPVSNGQPNINLAVPAYMITMLPPGLVGLSLVALFAAAMSSLDSVLNSLSAATMEDFVRPASKNRLNDKQELWLSRVITIAWGTITLSLAFYVDDIAPTILESINKIGSLVNGPILGVFTLGLLTRTCDAHGAIAGLTLGFMVNLTLWLFVPEVSWLWWNVFGFITTFCCGWLTSWLNHSSPEHNLHVLWHWHQDASSTQNQVSDTFDIRTWRKTSLMLILWFTLLLLGLILI